MSHAKQWRSRLKWKQCANCCLLPILGTCDVPTRPHHWDILTCGERTAILSLCCLLVQSLHRSLSLVEMRHALLTGCAIMVCLTVVGCEAPLPNGPQVSFQTSFVVCVHFILLTWIFIQTAKQTALLPTMNRENMAPTIQSYGNSCSGHRYRLPSPA